MSLLKALFGSKKEQEPFDPDPGSIEVMPARPYRVLQADLPFYADPECRNRVRGARLIVLQCEDPRQEQRTIECMPAVKDYRQGQIVQWDINHKRLWDDAWYVNPDSGSKEKAWARSVEFVGKVYRHGHEAS
jgi:hypothetical protein